MKQLVVFTLALFVPVVVAMAAVDSANTIATDQGPLTVHPVEHATFVMQWDGKTIAVDPIGDAARFEALGDADLVLITDVHGDHLSPDTVKALLKPSTVVIGPAAVAEKLPETDRGRVTVIANGETFTWGNVVVEAIPMYNLTPERQDFHVRGRGNGYIVTIGGARIYISGDTEDIPEMRALEGIRAAFVCMNLPYTMDVEAAASAVLEFKPEIVFPYHYRGQGGMSDLEKFRSLVAQDPAIEVRLLEWY